MANKYFIPHPPKYINHSLLIDVPSTENAPSKLNGHSGYNSEFAVCRPLIVEATQEEYRLEQEKVLETKRKNIDALNTQKHIDN